MPFCRNAPAQPRARKAVATTSSSRRTEEARAQFDKDDDDDAVGEEGGEGVDMEDEGESMLVTLTVFISIIFFAIRARLFTNASGTPTKVSTSLR